MKNPTPLPPEVMASRIPCDTVDKKITKNQSFLFCLPNVIVIKTAHNNAKRIECVNPRCPNGCSYGIPKLKLITSRSGIMADTIAKKTNSLE